MFTVTILDRDKIAIEHNYKIVVERYSAYVRGGPHQAVLAAYGENLELLRRWLGGYVIIANDNGNPVWWGKITATSTPWGKLTIGTNFDEMHNRVQTLYTALSSDGLAIPNASQWVQDDRSITAFGAKELRHTLGISNAAQATAMAAAILKDGSLARQEIGLSYSESATLSCSGLWSLLDWTYYANSAGLFAYSDLGLIDDEMPVGWGITSTQIGFSSNGIHRIDGNLGDIPNGEKVTVSGSGSNNGVRSTVATRDSESYTANTISFDAGDDILDSAARLGIVRIGSFIRVTGSPANSRNHLVDGVGANAVAVSTTVTGTITTEAAGPVISISQAGTLDVEESVILEVPGATVTLSMPTKLATRFLFTSSASWVGGEVIIPARRVGNPVDSLKVSIYNDNVGAIGGLVAAGTLSGNLIGERLDWVIVPIAATLTLGATYWVVIERTGANDAANYYHVGTIEGSGSLSRWNGTAWVSEIGVIPFQIWGTEETTKQLLNLLLQEGQFFSGADVRVFSGKLERQYREGNLPALAEAEKLLDLGTNSGDVLIPTVTVDFRCVVSVTPDGTAPDWVYSKEGRLETALGSPAEAGYLPVGMWCALDGADQDVDSLAPLSPFLIGFMEWSNGRISDIKPYGSVSVWDMPTLLQG